MLTLETFRQLRDEFALNDYRQRWPKLAESEQTLRAQIGDVRTQIEVAETQQKKGRTREERSTWKHVVEQLESQRIELYWQLQVVTCELNAIWNDVPLRKERLGLI